MKIVINRSNSGFAVSKKGFEYLITECDWKFEPLPERDEDFDKVSSNIFLFEDGEYDFVIPNTASPKLRQDKDLIKMVEHLGKEASAEGARLKVVDVPVDIVPFILDSNGFEYVVDQTSVWPDPTHELI